jgi:alanyl-tRNA synthetase
MGVERTSAILQGRKTVYETEAFLPILKILKDLAGPVSPPSAEGSLRIIADHLKAAVFILGDERGVRPSNLGQGYILRRLIRRAIRHGRKIGLEGNFLNPCALAVAAMYEDIYPELGEKKEFIIQELERETEKFLSTLHKGEQEFEKMVPNLLKNPQKIIPGRVAFRLYDTYGFPVELTQELAAERGLTVDTEAFHEAFEKHQELSKQGSEKVFKGGLADHSQMTTALHTATHLLHKALRTVLGDHVQQKGSNITPDRLRFDFTHPDKLTEAELKQVEDLVNAAIQGDLKVTMEIMTLEEAKAAGALAFFGDKYEEKVKVYTIGDFSKEVCGGPHVEHTGLMGRFSIQKEQSSSSGVRRIRAVLEA